MAESRYKKRHRKRISLNFGISKAEKFAEYFLKASAHALADDGKEAFGWLAGEEVRHAKILKERRAKFAGK